jgi:hypothetical protein
LQYETGQLAHLKVVHYRPDACGFPPKPYTMIKKSIPTFLMFMILSIAHGQEIRLMGGFNTTQIGETGPAVSMSGGAGIQFEADAQFGQRFYVQPGLGYVLRNAVFTTISADHAEARLVESDYRNHALRLSLMGGYRFLDEIDREAFNIRAFFGPSILIGMGSRFDNALVGEVPDNNTQFFLTLGAGLEKGIFFADAGYDFAFSDAFDLADAEARFNLFRVNFGVRLRLLGRTADSPVITP